jgi:hypothetical protein
MVDINQKIFKLLNEFELSKKDKKIKDYIKSLSHVDKTSINTENYRALVEKNFIEDTRISEHSIGNKKFTDTLNLQIVNTRRIDNEEFLKLKKDENTFDIDILWMDDQYFIDKIDLLDKFKLYTSTINSSLDTISNINYNEINTILKDTHKCFQNIYNNRKDIIVAVLIIHEIQNYIDTRLDIVNQADNKAQIDAAKIAKENQSILYNTITWLGDLSNQYFVNPTKNVFGYDSNNKSWNYAQNVIDNLSKQNIEQINEEIKKIMGIIVKKNEIIKKNVFKIRNNFLKIKHYILDGKMECNNLIEKLTRLILYLKNDLMIEYDDINDKLHNKLIDHLDLDTKFDTDVYKSLNFNIDLNTQIKIMLMKNRDLNNSDEVEYQKESKNYDDKLLQKRNDLSNNEVDTKKLIKEIDEAQIRYKNILKNLSNNNHDEKYIEYIKSLNIKNSINNVINRHEINTGDILTFESIKNTREILNRYLEEADNKEYYNTIVTQIKNNKKELDNQIKKIKTDIKQLNEINENFTNIDISKLNENKTIYTNALHEIKEKHDYYENLRNIDFKDHAPRILHVGHVGGNDFSYLIIISFVIFILIVVFYLLFNNKLFIKKNNKCKYYKMPYYIPNTQLMY